MLMLEGRAYQVVHWLLVSATITMAIVLMVTVFRTSHEQSWDFIGQSVFLIFIAVIFTLEIFSPISITKGRKALYCLLLISAIAPILTGLASTNDLVVFLGAMTMMISVTFPILILIGGFFVSTQPSFIEGKMTPLILSLFSAAYNFFQFSIIS